MRIQPEWLSSPMLRAVFDALDGRALVVGGAVRNACLSHPAGDIDVATPLTPDEVTRRLKNAGIRAVPTGIEHGTVTAVADHEAFEITTYRSDVSTDGRRATVRFSTLIEEDAARRDFTINALYLDLDGTVIDPLGSGLADLDARRVRFIGKPEARIAEDYLRILRFFRFTAYYSDTLDPEGLEACTAHLDGLDGLARERIGAEMRKLLAAPNPASVVVAMTSSGVLPKVLPGSDPIRLLPLIAIEKTLGAPPVPLAARLPSLPDWRIRLASLGAPLPDRALRLSRAETRFLIALAGLLDRPKPTVAEAYLAGPELAYAAGLLRAAANAAPPPDRFYADLMRGAEAELPVTASDLMAAGVLEGPSLGRALERARDAWIASDFSLDSDALLRKALDKGH